MSKSHAKKIALLPLVFAVFGLGACTLVRDYVKEHQMPVISVTDLKDLNAYPVAGDQAVLQAQSQQLRKVQVTLGGVVYRKLPDDTKGLPHERWLMQLSNGSTVLIAHDTKLAPYIPLEEGSPVTIHGEYIWNDKGGVIHWTHHDPQGRHDPGWVDFNGQRYQ